MAACLITQMAMRDADTYRQYAKQVGASLPSTPHPEPV